MLVKQTDKFFKWFVKRPEILKSKSTGTHALNNTITRGLKTNKSSLKILDEEGGILLKEGGLGKFFRRGKKIDYAKRMRDAYVKRTGPAGPSGTIPMPAGKIPAWVAESENQLQKRIKQRFKGVK